MIYVFDTSSLQHLFGFFPQRFPSLWQKVDALISEERIISVREVSEEAKKGNKISRDWLTENRDIFQIPEPEELIMLREQIFSENRFQQILDTKRRLRGGPFADPFVIAKAKIIGGTVVTEEKYKPNSVKIPTICEFFDVGCTNLEGFMVQEEWQF